MLESERVWLTEREAYLLADDLLGLIAFGFFLLSGGVLMFAMVRSAKSGFFTRSTTTEKDNE